MSIFDKFRDVGERLKALEQSGVNPLGATIEQIISPTEGVVAGNRVILAGTNNYLGLTFDPDCIAAAQEAVAQQGTGTTGSRMANGSYVGHVALEQELAEFYGVPAAIVYSTGFFATMGMVSTLAGEGDVILMDADCHASIYEGTRLTAAEVIRFRHNDAGDLEKRLRRLGERAARTLIVVEGIYSMLGDQAPLGEIAAVKREYGGYLMVDEAHSLGILGDTGRGVAQAAGVEEDVDFTVGTFSKSLGSVGGFCTSRHRELDLVRYATRCYIFTASLAPSVIASTRVALGIVASRPSLRTQLWRSAERLHAGLLKAGFKVGPRPGPVVAVEVQRMDTALAWWQQLVESGVYVNMVLPPATPTGNCLLRCSLSAAHSDEQVEQILGAYLTLPNHEQGIAA